MRKEPETIQTVGILGFGQMGSGIGQLFAMKGKEVWVYEPSSTQWEKGLKNVRFSLEKFREKGKIQEEVGRVLSRLRKVESLTELKGVDLVVEAVVEDEKIKTELFKELNSVVPEEVIFASNTSSISITRMGKNSGRADRFVGMHFMNPPQLLQLVEVVVGLSTSEETVNFIEELARYLGKTPVRAEDYPGFIVNRILLPMINEAIYALQDGVGSPEHIDTAMVLGTNQPMGPLRLADLIGLDTVLAIMEVMHHTFGEDKYRPAPLLRRYVDAGYLGRKTGRGFYEYREKGDKGG
jgi:3-hydroxybutyryl-CoA dehydrogenase